MTVSSEHFKLPRIPVIHVQSLQVALRHSCQFVNNVAEARCCGDVHTRLPTLVIIVDYGRALVVAQDDGAQNSISTLKESQRKLIMYHPVLFLAYAC